MSGEAAADTAAVWTCAQPARQVREETRSSSRSVIRLQHPDRATDRFRAAPGRRQFHTTAAHPRRSSASAARHRPAAAKRQPPRAHRTCALHHQSPPHLRIPMRRAAPHAMRQAPGPWERIDGIGRTAAGPGELACRQHVAQPVSAAALTMWFGRAIACAMAVRGSRRRKGRRISPAAPSGQAVRPALSRGRPHDSRPISRGRPAGRRRTGSAANRTTCAPTS